MGGDERGGESHEPEARRALDLIASGHFSPGEPGRYAPIIEALLTHGDPYMHLADLKSYLEADQKLRGMVIFRTLFFSPVVIEAQSDSRKAHI